jgi:hypothetical protein
MTERSGCEETHDVIPELAAGTLTGAERATALHHLATCANCRRDLEDMAQLVDSITAIAPSEDPPAAFESRVLARIGDVRRPSRWRRLAPYLGSVLITAAVVGGTVGWATAEDRSMADRYRKTLHVAQGRYLTAAAFYDDQGRVGTAFAYQGSPNWVLLVVKTARISGAYQAMLVRTDGARERLGEFTVTAGEGCWSVTIDSPIRQTGQIILSRSGNPDIIAAFSH